jgi:hypothetical protein
VGFYLSYDHGGEYASRGPNGETILVSAYIFRYPHRRQQHIGLGSCWVHTIAEAKALVEGNVAAYFGQELYGPRTA